MHVSILPLTALLLYGETEPVQKDASRITWIHDDWARAKVAAIDGGQLVAVDVWATWCHTCLSMKNYVLKKKAMAAVARRHVWLALDFDRPENAGFFEKFPVDAFPTFIIVDPKSETVVSRWVGSGTSKEMARFFATSEGASKDPLVLGHRALAREQHEEARGIFEDALRRPMKNKEARTRLLSGYIEALWKLDTKACAEIGSKHIAEVDNTAPGLDFVGMVAGCASDLDQEGTKRVMKLVRDRLAPVVGDASLPLSVDDRSSAYSILVDAYDALGEKENAEMAVSSRIRLLEDAASRASTPAERMTFDAHRLEVYMRLGRFADAEKMLALSESENPRDFNPPWRLAVLHAKQGRTEEGLAAIDRALAKGYGARRLRLYATKVDLLIQKRSFGAAKAAIAEAKAEVARMSAKQVRPSWLREVESKSEEIAKLEAQKRSAN